MDFLWLVFALLSAITASLVAIFGKIGLKSIDSNAATAIRAVIMAIFLFGVVVIQGKLKLLPEIFSDKKTLGFIVLSGIAGASSWLFYFLALKHGSVSKVAPVDKLSVVISTLLAILILGEKVNKTNLLGVGIITVGVVIVALS